MGIALNTYNNNITMPMRKQDYDWFYGCGIASQLLGMLGMVDGYGSIVQ